MAKSSKPLVWSLFAGGGMIAAFLIPAMIFITGLAVPIGLLPEGALAYDRVLAFVQNPIAKLALFAILFFAAWHAAHRMRMTLPDLGIRSRRLTPLVCYGAAAVVSVLAGYALISV